jgi:hypothetical protein
MVLKRHLVAPLRPTPTPRNKCPVNASLIPSNSVIYQTLKRHLSDFSFMFTYMEVIPRYANFVALCSFKHADDQFLSLKKKKRRNVYAFKVNIGLHSRQLKLV